MNSLLLFKSQLKREWLLKSRQMQSVLNAFLLFLTLILFAPLALPYDKHILQTILPELLWSALLFSMLLSTEGLFQAEYQEGILEQWKISQQNLNFYLYPKILVTFIAIIMPIIVVSPFIAIIFSLNLYQIIIINISIILASIALIFLCALVQSFAISLKQKGLIMALLLMPLSIPVMIFTTLAINAGILMDNVCAYFALLLAIDLLIVCFLPNAIRGILKLDL